ncbi:MAG TPA: hypothetical protein VNC60_03735 [Actinomycetota bacterium]|nr:hypothetical protein [Actinomycetota bacterium]
MRSRSRRSPDGYDEAGEPVSYLRPVRYPRLTRAAEVAAALRSGPYAGAHIAWHVRLASWALVALPAWLLFDPIWILPAIVGVELVWMVGLQWSAAMERSRQRVAIAEADRRRHEVFASFGATGDPIWLSGGEGPAWRVGDLVFKQAPSEQEWSWLGAHLPTVREDGFRIALPVPAPGGRWVVDGLCAQTWLAGAHPNAPRWREVLLVCERLHAAMRHLPRPPFLEARTDPWAIGDRVAWGEVDPPVAHAFLARLLTIRRPVELPSQTIHGDLTENVLFHDGLAPAVIDLSVYWRPAGFASAVVVGDAICWANAEPAPLLAATEHLEEFPQLFVRAVIFRLATTLVVGARGLGPYARVVDLAEELAG